MTLPRGAVGVLAQFEIAASRFRPFLVFVYHMFIHIRNKMCCFVLQKVLRQLYFVLLGTTIKIKR